MSIAIEDGENPQIEGLKSAMEFLRVQLAEERVARYRAERTMATMAMERAQLEAQLARLRSQGISCPRGLYARHFKDFFGGDQ